MVTVTGGRSYFPICVVAPQNAWLRTPPKYAARFSGVPNIWIILSGLGETKKDALKWIKASFFL